MNNATSFVSGMILGAGLMYLLDPERGNRRRALLRDQVVHAGHELEDLGGEVASAARHRRNQALGAVAEARGRLRREDVDDSVLEARVRSEIGRAVSHPGAVQVTARNGRVTLSGPVLESELEELLATVERIRGVQGVENRLDAHAGSEGVPGLQGTPR